MVFEWFFNGFWLIFFLVGFSNASFSERRDCFDGSMVC